jgi:hypothetical protein
VQASTAGGGDATGFVAIALAVGLLVLTGLFASSGFPVPAGEGEQPITSKIATRQIECPHNIAIC